MVQIKTESGAKVKANKTGIYKKWKQQSHNKVSLRGANSEGNAEGSTSMSGNSMNWKLLVACFIYTLTLSLEVG